MRRLARLEQAAILHQLADSDIVAPVLAGIADPHDSAVGQAEAARALDLEEEEVDRVGRPGDFEAPAGERPVLDLGALEIRDDRLRSRAGRGAAFPPPRRSPASTSTRSGGLR